MVARLVVPVLYFWGLVAIFNLDLSYGYSGEATVFQGLGPVSVSARGVVSGVVQRRRAAA